VVGRRALRGTGQGRLRQGRGRLDFPLRVRRGFRRRLRGFLFQGGARGGRLRIRVLRGMAEAYLPVRRRRRLCRHGGAAPRDGLPGRASRGDGVTGREGGVQGRGRALEVARPRGRGLAGGGERRRLRREGPRGVRTAGPCGGGRRGRGIRGQPSLGGGRVRDLRQNTQSRLRRGVGPEAFERVRRDGGRQHRLQAGCGNERRRRTGPHAYRRRQVVQEACASCVRRAGSGSYGDDRCGRCHAGGRRCRGHPAPGGRSQGADRAGIRQSGRKV